MPSHLILSRFAPVSQEEKEAARKNHYNPSPHQFEIDCCKALNLEIPAEKKFKNGTLEKLCVVCNSNRSAPGKFNMCPRCHYDRFYGLVTEGEEHGYIYENGAPEGTKEDDSGGNKGQSNTKKTYDPVIDGDRERVEAAEW